MASCRQGRHQASNQNSTGFGLKNFFRAPPARSAGKPMEHSYQYWLHFGTRSGCQNFRASFHQASNQNSTGFGLKNFFRAPPARSAGKPMEHSYQYWLRFGTRSGCQNFRASFHQASNQNSTGFGLKNFFRAPPARSAGKPMEHSYRYRLRFGGPIWLPKLPSIFPRVFENFQATDRSISHARRYRFPKIATGNRTILVSLSMFYAGHRWYM